ncbi:fatty acid desaturase [Lysobacter fragariae]
MSRALRPLGPLRERRDLQSLAYLTLQPVLMAWQWHHGFHWAPFAASLFLAVGISVIHHNHAHLPMWRRSDCNRATEFVLSALQGHPTFVFHPTHNRNHHRHCHGARDVARTWQFGDHNHLPGWLLHPVQVVVVLYPLALRWLRAMHRRAPAVARWYALQYVAWWLPWATLLALAPRRAFVLVIVPQLFGLHWLLAANYLQHAHADETSTRRNARNFEGLLNPLLFNIGLHSAHHRDGRAHWSQLPHLHRQLRGHIDVRMLESGFARYVLRTYVLGALVPRLRSSSLRAPAMGPPVTGKDC